MPPTRRYPRVRYHARATMQVRQGGRSRTVAVTMGSVSCEGAGLTLADRSVRLLPGTRITMCFKNDVDEFKLPGQVAWCARSNQPRGPFDMGVRFQLGAVHQSMRASYARWIVNLIRQRHTPEST